MTRICIFGAGAIGGYVGARLAKAQVADVSLVARGPHLEAMQAKGLSITQAGETVTVKTKVTAEPRELGRQDFIILTLKSNALPATAEALAPLIGPDTVLLFGQNGLPWWYFYKHGGRFDGRILESVDPGGSLWKKIGPERVLGGVIWLAAELGRPGHVIHGFGDRMAIGEPSGEISARATRLCALLEQAGVKSPVKTDLRNEIWLKLWGNLSFNPVSILTRGTLEGLARDSGTRAVLATMMMESRTVAEALGVNFSVSVEERLDMAAKVGAHRSSMLQDLDAGRPTELDALLGAVIELAHMTGIATPALKLVYDLARYRVQTA